MTLLSYLPLLRGWGFRVKVIKAADAFTVLAGEEKTLLEILKDGWFYEASMLVSNPDAELWFQYYDAMGSSRKESTTANYLYVHNLTTPNPTGIWCSVYAPLTPLYAIIYGAYNPVPFKKNFKLSIKAPTTGPVVVSVYTHAVVEIADEQQFKASVRELFSVPLPKLPEITPWGK